MPSVNYVTNIIGGDTGFIMHSLDVLQTECACGGGCSHEDSLVGTVVSRSFTCRVRLARKYSGFIRAMKSTLIPLGHTAWQSRCMVQLPKPSSSMTATIARTR
jgi:hypothetical protein